MITLPHDMTPELNWEFSKLAKIVEYLLPVYLPDRQDTYFRPFGDVHP